jgi:hypothetical protein
VQYVDHQHCAERRVRRVVQELELPQVTEAELCELHVNIRSRTTDREVSGGESQRDPQSHRPLKDSAIGAGCAVRGQSLQIDRRRRPSRMPDLQSSRHVSRRGHASTL